MRGQGIGAELIAEQWEIPRSELDELARALAPAGRAGHRGGLVRARDRADQVNGHTRARPGHPAGHDLEALAALKPAFKPDGRITAGNSSQISDGAAAVLLMSREKAEALGLTPRARIIDQTSVGCDPVKMLEGPIPATTQILERNGMTIDDIDYSRSTRRSRRSWPPGGASTTRTWRA